jgi:alkylation response protein AidB-like acyl-CoA dehydrogenase
MILDLTDEQKALQERVRQFAAERVAPHARAISSARLRRWG